MSADKPSNGDQGPPAADKPTQQQLARDYDFVRDLQVGSMLDVKDTASTWCLAEVTELHSDYVRVHYDGWSSKYDEARLWDNSLV